MFPEFSVRVAGRRSYGKCRLPRITDRAGEERTQQKRNRGMKKLHVLTVALLVAGAVSSWAQVENDRIMFGPVPITFKGKLSDGSTVTGATLNEGNLEFAAV